MRPISAKYTPMKWEEGEQVEDVANSRMVKIIKIVEPPYGLTQEYEAVFIDTGGKLVVDVIKRFSECAFTAIPIMRGRRE